MDEWMDDVSIMHGIFVCVSQAVHRILQMFHLDEHVSH
jgi:hypothetical protein